MFMQQAREKLQNWWKNWTMSADEQWLAQSSDIVELERKLEILLRPQRNFFY